MVSPYLLPENREAYLRSKGLIEGDISDDDREWLYFINPHYLIKSSGPDAEALLRRSPIW